jgi:heme exporter protein D
MKDLQAFLNMGGYAFYVWSAYGVAFVVLVAGVYGPMRTLRRTRDRIARAARARGALS